MKILTTSTGSQSIKFIPRTTVGSVIFSLIDKNKRTTSNIPVTVSNADGYMTVSGSFSLTEGVLYSFEVAIDDYYERVLADSGSIEGITCVDSNNIGSLLYRDTIFCTDQTDYRKYTVNQGEYTTENTYDNDFIVL